MNSKKQSFVLNGQIIKV